jgi:hypothetical protein
MLARFGVPEHVFAILYKIFLILRARARSFFYFARFAAIEFIFSSTSQGMYELSSFLRVDNSELASFLSPASTLLGSCPFFADGQPHSAARSC